MIRTQPGRTSKSWRKSWVKAKSQEFERVKFEGGGETEAVPLASCSYVQGVVDTLPAWPTTSFSRTTLGLPGQTWPQLLA